MAVAIPSRWAGAHSAGPTTEATPRNVVVCRYSEQPEVGSAPFPSLSLRVCVCGSPLSSTASSLPRSPPAA